MNIHQAGQITRVFVALLMLVLIFSGFPPGAVADGSIEAFAEGSEPEETTPPQETTPPEETTPPDETQPPSDGEDTDAPDEELTPSEVPIWSWVLAGLVLVGAVAWMVTRSGSSTDGPAEGGGGA